VAKYGSYVETTLTFNIHEVGVGRLDQSLLLMFPLFVLWAWVEKVSLDKRHGVLEEVKKSYLL